MADTQVPAPPQPSPPLDEPTGGFWTDKRNVLSLLLVAVIAALGVWLIVDDPDPAAPDRGDGVAAPAPNLGELACGPAGSGSQVPPAQAPDTEWTLLGSMAAPTSPDVGPADTADGVPVCFSPDPAGALFTAATFLAASSDPDLRAEALDELVAEGPGRDAAAADLDSRGPGTETVGVQLAGFAFGSYREGEGAVVNLALAYEGRLLTVPIELAWTGEDWRVVLPVTGRAFDAMQAIPSLAGYTEWRGA